MPESIFARTSGANENHWATPVHYQGCVYGLYGSTHQEEYFYARTPLKCLKLDTLEEQWSVDGFGPGGIILVNNKHPLVPMSTLRAGYRLVLHGLSTEMLHSLLCEMKAERNDGEPAARDRLKAGAP